MKIAEAIQRIEEHKEIHSHREPHAVHITEALDMALAALRTAQEREKPEPLTYEEYSGLEESTPVWVVDGDKQETWALANNDGDCVDSDTGLWEQTYYGLKGDGYLGLHSVGWLAYRSRPEETDNVDK